MWEIKEESRLIFALHSINLSTFVYKQTFCRYGKWKCNIFLMYFKINLQHSDLKKIHLHRPPHVIFCISAHHVLPCGKHILSITIIITTVKVINKDDTPRASYIPGTVLNASIYFCSCDPNDNHVMRYGYYPPLCKWGHWGTERFSNLLRATVCMEQS